MSNVHLQQETLPQLLVQRGVYIGTPANFYELLKRTEYVVVDFCE